MLMINNYVDLNPFTTPVKLNARYRDRPSPRRPRGAPPGPPGPTLWFPGTARVRSPGPSAETFHETTPFVDFRPPEGDGRSALLRPLSAVELCRQFVPSCSRAYRTFLSYNKRSLESLLKWLRSLTGPAGLRVLKDWRGQRRRRCMTCGTEKLRAGGGKCSA